MPNATRCQLPPGSQLRDSLLRIDYLDSFEVPSRTPEQDVVLIYAAAFGTGRNYAVGDRIGRWTLFAKHQDELITGANDRHLDFRVSVFRDARPRIVLSTAVMTHNTLGRAYLATILPFHRFGVATLLGNASAAGRI